MDVDPDIPDYLKNEEFVQAFLGKLSVIENKIIQQNSEIENLDTSISTLTKEREAFRQEMVKKLNELAKREANLLSARQAVVGKINEATHTRDSIKKELQDNIEGYEAHKQLRETRAEWDAVMAENNWLWVKSIFDYQKIGCEFIASGLRRELFGVLLADQQGLGKTLQATAAINLLQYQSDFEEIIGPRCPRLPTPVGLNTEYPKEWYSVLWICPNKIKKSTMREIAKWSSDLTVVALDGSPDQRDLIARTAHREGMVLVCSYEQLRDRKGLPVTPALFDVDWPLVIMDEAHKFKNSESNTFVAIEKICLSAGFIVPMTGTPIQNRPEEFWAILHMLTLKGKNKDKFKDKRMYEMLYLDTWYGSSKFKHGGFNDLINNVKDMVLRRRKDEVLNDLPDKIREVRFVQLSGEQADLYDQMRDKLYIWLDEQKSSFVNATSILAQLTRLRQIALYPAGVKVKISEDEEKILNCHESAKLDEAMAVIEELIESDEKVLVFSNYNAPLFELQRRVREAGYVYTDNSGHDHMVESGAIVGGLRDKEIEEADIRFNNPDDPMRILVGNISAMGVGLNLQGACSHAIFLDLHWSPGVNEQAEDRLHRQGQKSNVTIHIIQAEDSVDGFIAQKLEGKLKMIEGVIERDELRRALDEGLI